MDGSQSPLADTVVQLDQLPPLSATADQLLRAVADPDLDAPHLTAILEQDPPLTARIVGLANSAFFGQSRPVLGVEEAIIRVLGLNMVRSLALSMVLAGTFDTRRCPAYDLRHYWLMSLGSATLARDLAGAVARPALVHPDAAYLCGLLHNLGELALVHLRPDLMCEALHARRAQPDCDLATLQRQYLGMDSWQAGAMLAFHWHLPEGLQQVIAFFSGGEAEGPHRQLVQVTAAARAWVGASLAGELPQVTPPDAAAAEFQRIVQAFHGRLDELRQLAAAML